MYRLLFFSSLTAAVNCLHNLLLFSFGHCFYFFVHVCLYLCLCLNQALFHCRLPRTAFPDYELAPATFTLLPPSSMDNERASKRPRVSPRSRPPVTIEDDLDPESPSSPQHYSNYTHTCSNSASASNTAGLSLFVSRPLASVFSKSFYFWLAAGTSPTPHEGMAAGHDAANFSPLGPLGRTDVCETLSSSPDIAMSSTEPSASAFASPILIPPTVSLVATKSEAESVAFHELPLATLNFKALTVALLSHSVPLSGKKRKLEILRDLAFAHRCNDECRNGRFFMQASFSTPKPPPPQGAISSTPSTKRQFRFGLWVESTSKPSATRAGSSRSISSRSTTPTSMQPICSCVDILSPS